MEKGILGRKIRFTWNGTVIPGMREKSLAANGEPVNVSDDDSTGWRELLEEAGENAVDVSGSGVLKGDALRAAWFNGAGTEGQSSEDDEVKRQAEGMIEYPDGGILTGLFNLVSYNETGPYNDATTFEASFQSSGQIVYSPPSEGA